MVSRLRRAYDRLPERVRAVLDLVVATARDSSEDRVPGLAAEIGFWLTFSIPPLLLATASIAGLVGAGLGQDVRTDLIGRIEELALQVFTERTVEESVTPILDALLTEGSGSVLSLSFVATLYSASRALRVIVHAVTIAYDLEEHRPTWLSRLLGIGMTVVGLVLGLVLIPLVVAGPQLGAIIEERFGMDDLFLAEAWTVAYWPASILLVTLLLAGLYHFATPWSTPFRRELPGALLATVLALAVSVGLRTYTSRTISADSVYASLAAPLAVLLWTWLVSVALLIGAELNAEIEKAYPAGGPVSDPPTLSDLGRRAVAGVRSVVPSKDGGGADDDAAPQPRGRANDSS